jgi:hypothetical protein
VSSGIAFLVFPIARDDTLPPPALPAKVQRGFLSSYRRSALGERLLGGASEEGGAVPRALVDASGQPLGRGYVNRTFRCRTSGKVTRKATAQFVTVLEHAGNMKFELFLNYTARLVIAGVVPAIHGNRQGACRERVDGRDQARP